MQSTQSTSDANNTIAPSAHDFEIFSGETTTAEARVYARLNTIGGGKSNLAAQIAGQLIGPFCEFSQTLPAQHRFLEIDQRAREQKTALVQAIVPDPCFWTPELPFQYRAQLQASCGNEISEVQRTIGIRRLGVRGKSLFFDGKRFVLRATECKLTGAELKSYLEQNQDFLRETWTALILQNPGNDMCEFASRRGILLVADLTESNDFARSEVLVHSLRRLSQWPAVGIAVLAGNAVIAEQERSEIRSLLLAQFLAATDPVISAPWADLVLIEVGLPNEFPQRITGLNTPVIALRRLSPTAEIEQARSECDILQRDLAPHCDCAGYAT